MWIRSQCKMQLIPMEIGYLTIDLMNKKIILFCIGISDPDSYTCIGEYSTEEKALKVLDMIQEVIETVHMMSISSPKGKDAVFSGLPADEIADMFSGTFQVPQDSEV